MGEPLLTVERLRVEYDDVTAVDDVSFTVESSMVYGLIGPNGAGKTSVIRALAGLTDPSWGRVNIAGVDLLQEPQRALRHVGFMPDMPPLYEDLTVREFMELFASAYALEPSLRQRRINDLVEQVKLTGKLDSPAGSLSRGMRQRLFLAKTLLHDPDVLFLDEPASGLDPLARLEFCQIMVALGQMGTAVLVSSHILQEMADFCNAVGIMEKGRMVVSGRIDDILRRIRPGLHIRARLLAPDERACAFLDGRAGLRDVQVDGADVNVTLDGGMEDAHALLRAMVLADMKVASFQIHEGDLQDIFKQVSTGEVS
ncbi:MAG: ABC transporter ATP-binding protein [Deltaproteobacteria bacterium]|nr:ABC transporter ATP-binding protein [Deltaproteobacteria bacterium]